MPNPAAAFNENWLRGHMAFVEIDGDELYYERDSNRCRM